MIDLVSQLLSLELIEQIVSIVAGILFVLATIYPLLKKRRHYYHVVLHWFTRGWKVFLRLIAKNRTRSGTRSFGYSIANKKTSQ
jgi:predicted PurR-regulated permease PerM